MFRHVVSHGPSTQHVFRTFCYTWINFAYLVYHIEALLIATRFWMNTHQPLLYLARLQTI